MPADRSLRACPLPLLSAVGRDKEVVREYIRKQDEEDARLERLKSWFKLLPLERLAVSDRYELLASIIKVVEEADAVFVACLAKWLYKGGTADVDEIKRWDAVVTGLGD